MMEILRTTKNPTTERFAARLAAEEQMKDTTGAQPSAADQFRAEAVAVANMVPGPAYAVPSPPPDGIPLSAWVHYAQIIKDNRDDLLNRIATLEADLAETKRLKVEVLHDYSNLFFIERQTRKKFRERIAAITKAFYHPELSISSTQPIIALALELNPDLVERTR